MTLPRIDGSLPDWESLETNVLLNPRMPETQRTALIGALEAMPSLSGHVWLTTSGSNGLKWVALSKEAVLASAQAVNEHLASSAADIWALALPTFHVGGLGVLARGFLSGAAVHRYAGASDGGRWDAGAFYAFLTATKATLTTLVPTQLHDLVSASLVSPPRLRAVVIGGGELGPDLYGAARALGWPVLPSYGLSECCSQVATASPASLTSGLGQGVPPLCLLSHVSARISPDGRIMVRSPALLTGYGLPDPDQALGARFVDPKESGWLLTDDVGALAGDTLTVRGRTGDFVKIGGESVDLGRLERLWAQTAAAETALPEAVLLAAPDVRLGAVIHLVATGGPSAEIVTAQAVQAFNRLVLPFERVQQIHWVDEIPRSPLGKLLRKEVLAKAGFRTG